MNRMQNRTMMIMALDERQRQEPEGGKERETNHRRVVLCRILFLSSALDFDKGNFETIPAYTNEKDTFDLL